MAYTQREINAQKAAALADSCPITNTIYDDDLSRDTYTIITGGEQVSVTTNLMQKNYKLSANAKRFIAMFDSGLIPELIDYD